MARRIAEPNGDAPPPSTLAAQIVQNRTRAPTTAESPNGESVTFAQLLDEILHNPSAGHETDPAVNVKLIHVVAEAGLARLTQASPFEWDRLFQLAIDSMTVIQATIERQPELVSVPVSEHGPQLLLVLFSHLLAVCGRDKCQDLPILRLVDSTIRGLEASSNMWQIARKIRTLCRDIVDDILNFVEAVEPSATVAILTPPAHCIAELFPSAGDQIALPHTYQTMIADRIHAILLCVTLIQVNGQDHTWQRETNCRLSAIVWSMEQDLTERHQWISAITCLLALPGCLDLIRNLISDISAGILHPELQPALADALINELTYSPMSIRSSAVHLQALIVSPYIDDIDPVLENAVSRCISIFVASQEVPTQLHPSTQFARKIRQPRRKRRSDSYNRADSALAQNSDNTTSLASQLCKRLGVSDSHPMTRLSEKAVSNYSALDDVNQCAIWEIVAELVPTDRELASNVITALMELPAVQQAKRPRILSLIAISSLVQASTDEGILDLSKSRLGHVCLSSLHSSLRELRIAASQCLPGFLRDDLPEKLRHDNRRIAMEYLRVLSDRDATNEHETLICTWGRVALTCGDEEMNLVLLRLIEYLGHRNSIVCAAAYSELQQLASHTEQSMEEMMAPFWGSIAIAVVQDINARPQKIQQLCDLLNCDVNQFLINTQQHTVPVFVLTKKKELIQRIAHAHGADGTVQTVCLRPIITFATTIALLLTQPVSDSKTFTLTYMCDYLPDYSESDIVNQIKLHSNIIICQMLIICARTPADRKAACFRSFRSLAMLASSKLTSGTKAQAKSTRIVADLFEEYILGIMAYFSEVLDNTRGQISPLHDKLEALRAIIDMLTHVKDLSVVGLPQLRAFLQSSMEQPKLTCTAFMAWLALMAGLDGEDVITIIDQTFVLVTRHWEQLSLTLQQAVHDEISKLLKNHHQLVQEHILTIPALHGIPLLAKIASQIESVKNKDSISNNCIAFTTRLSDDNELISMQALRELVPYLEVNQEALYDGAISEQAPAYLSGLIRALLDFATRDVGMEPEMAELCGKSLGIIGCVDPNRVEASRKVRQILVLHDFEKATEVVDWIAGLFEDVLTKAFKSVSNARSQGFLAFVMQELLRLCKFDEEATLRPRSGSQAQTANQRWHAMPEHVQITLTPFLTSRYVLSNTAPAPVTARTYPSFSADKSHGDWLRGLVLDLLWRAKGENAPTVFHLLARAVNGHDLAIARFLLPYAMLNVVLGGTVGEITGILDEILAVLRCEATATIQLDTVKQCSESVFAALDYMSIWLHEKKKALGESRAAVYKGSTSASDFDEIKHSAQIDNVTEFLAKVPAETIANRALECGAYGRALFHWEQYIRQQRSIIPSPPLEPGDEAMFRTLHLVYAQIDEPDGLEGIGTHLSFLTEEQQVSQHIKAGRWTAAQAWFELQATIEPTISRHQTSLLTCLKETGKYTALLRYVDSFSKMSDDDDDDTEMQSRHTLLPFAAEACWMTGDAIGLRHRLADVETLPIEDFSVGMGRLLLSISHPEFENNLRILRKSTVDSLTTTSTNSLQNCHNELRQLHAIYEIEAIAKCSTTETNRLMGVLEKRASILESYSQDRSMILGLRRAAMTASPSVFPDAQVAPLWITAAKLARKAGNMLSAYDAVIKAIEYGDPQAKLEEARLLWHDGHQRQAIQALEAAIKSGLFGELKPNLEETSTNGPQTNRSVIGEKNIIAAKAHLMLAKWLDASGQVQTKDMTERYRTPSLFHMRWEKGHYYLGKHYNNLLEAEKILPKNQQSGMLLGGDLARLTIENLIRSVPFGNKYWHQTIPKILTLWLDLGAEVANRAKGEDVAMFERRTRSLAAVNKQLERYFDRIPSYVWYMALPQIVSRITNPHADTWKLLCSVLAKVVMIHPSQALWSILPLMKSSDSVRIARGQDVLGRVRDPKFKVRGEAPVADMKSLILHGQRLTDGLLQACEHPIEPRKTHVNLGRDLGFNHKLAPCALVVPVERTLSVNLPAEADAQKIRSYKAFAHEKITITAFMEDVLVLSSLQRPRKITIRGSDGKQYGLLCKPKDDLRKDQRLMEFNGLINRALKRDAESSKRRLYIKTYAVTPLSEESGTIEWVEGIKPLRDILLHIYARKGIRPNYNEIKVLLNEACKSPEQSHLFTNDVLKQFPASLHEWFREVYIEPDTWFAARLRYARSAAVTSMTGHVLGLGDRHGENILLEESGGGVFHVDFNCLFDKGLTFEKPELVPFRLTHNMVDAMGPYGYEGPFRRSSEITMALLRQNYDTLMTVLETFLYDPTTDFVGKKKRNVRDVPETPREILESVQRKLKGLLRGETVPLSTEGYVDALIREAVNPFNLASMYIGWCSFL